MRSSLGISLVLIFCLFSSMVPVLHAEPLAGYVCNPGTKECFLDLIRDDSGDIIFPGCLTFDAAQEQHLLKKGYRIIPDSDIFRMIEKDPDFSFCDEGKDPFKKDKSSDDESSGVPQEIEGFNLVGYNDGGKKAWDIKGDKANILGDQVDVTNVNAYSYGEQEVNIKARKGKLDKATGNVFLEKDVVITSEGGARMTTNTLEWQRQKDLVRTTDKVMIEDDQMTVTGTGLQAHPDRRDARLQGDVTANISAAATGDKKDNRIEITSDGPMEIVQAEQKAVFYDNVVAIELSTGRRLKADRMDVTFDEQSRKIKEIVCTGNVELHQGGNVSHSDSLVYQADEQKMTLTGRPKILIDPGQTDTKEFLKY